MVKSLPGSAGQSVAAAIGDEGAAVPEHCRRFLTTPAILTISNTHTHRSPLKPLLCNKRLTAADYLHPDY